MESHSNDMEQNRTDKKVNFEGLEPLLQKCYNNKDLQVVHCTATKLLPAGENYGSIMVKIDAIIRRNKTAKEEMWHLVGKTPSRSENPIVAWPLIFQKERFIYAELFPVYRELEKEVGIDDNNLINVLPRFIGYRNSLKDKAEIDDDSVLLMENLKVKGFYMVNKLIGMDVHHARKALTSLARYHALGIVVKQRRPSFAQKGIQQADILAENFAPIDIVYADACEILTKIPHLKKYSTAIETSFEQAKNGGSENEQPVEPWATITHGDFWSNNMLFHQDDEGNVDDVKFVDFQAFEYGSPLRDVCCLLGSSLDKQAQTYHLEELLSLYYDAFVKSLKRMSCDVSLFTRESFDREVTRQAIREFPLSVLSLKFVSVDVIDENKSNEENIENVINAKPNDVFVDRIVWLAEVYERMKWF